MANNSEFKKKIKQSDNINVEEIKDQIFVPDVMHLY